MEFNVIQKDMGPLHRLLLKACNPVHHKRSIPLLAKQIDYKPQSIYAAINKNMMHPHMAVRISTTSEEVAFEDFTKWIMNYGVNGGTGRRAANADSNISKTGG